MGGKTGAGEEQTGMYHGTKKVDGGSENERFGKENGERLQFARWRND